MVCYNRNLLIESTLNKLLIDNWLHKNRKKKRKKKWDSQHEIKMILIIMTSH